MSTLENLFAEKLLKVKAIKLQPSNPFTWASGWKSPFYCDNRKTLSYPSLRNFVKVEISRLILEKFGQVDAIAGVATGAIAQGALVAEELNLPFVYVRSSPKDHGLENLIEGELRPGMKVVVIEDLISTGGSSLKAVEAIRNNGCEVVGMVASYTYGFDVAKKAFEDANVKLVTLTNYEAVIEVALQTGYITEGQYYLKGGRIEPFGSLSRLKQNVNNSTRDDHRALMDGMIRLYANYKDTLEKKSMGFNMSAWDEKLLAFGTEFEAEMMDLSKNISLEDALDLGWKILADCFEPSETGVKSALVEKYWPKK